MAKLFHPDNPVMIFLSHIWDLIVLNACFLITCIPVFTVGASLTALYSVGLKMAEGEFDGSASAFFASFRSNFKPATLLWIVLLPVSVFLGFDLCVIFFVIDPAFRLLQIPVWILVFLDVSVLLYAFPLLSRYEQTLPVLLKNAVRLSLGNLPTTVFMVVILSLILDLSLHNGSLLVLFFSLALFFGCALLARFFSLFLLRIFKKTEENPPE